MTPRIKICGLRDAKTAAAAARLGADAIGLVFYPPSPRNVDAVVARAICGALPPFVTSVGLFVDADPALVRAVLDQVPLDLLQFHGDEAPDYCRAFGRPYMKAVRVKHDVNLLEYAARYADARGLLVDAFVDGVPGGTGAAFDWRLLPPGLPLPLVLSGGLDPDNVAAAVAQVRPWAVDVSSGVEARRGVKDLARIAAFIQAVRAASIE
ncbi:phosphoribosylanthranilate isomerase [Chitiniphilus purpureus]|uniref:N-(5'-phosphoribosyl)anthranilate isomerase n=1 Tax=Chitiniphilus purpureus TaxID=2981137 RepID=A0ABY6DJX5_9NEIS|nr:phosphoribosylanthranilate isomerase [Chitiniphilus sp. CD1]UXY13736.1 phosphoribosylanthranilate isomerase [Chitiniphilus sp. CD1]